MSHANTKQENESSAAALASVDSLQVLTVITADCRSGLQQIPDQTVDCCVTSPPYFGLRDYGHTGQIGREASCEEYIRSLCIVMEGVWRVLRDDGTLWLNLGDTYAGGGNGGGGSFANDGIRAPKPGTDKNVPARQGSRGVTVKSKRLPRGEGRWGGGNVPSSGFKKKDLMGIPWRVALALQSAGWYLRSDIIWSKPNATPESVTDRPTRAHEYLFLLTKSPTYYYDHDAIKEPPSPALLKQIEEGYNGQAIKDYIGSSVQDASATKSRIINGYRKRIDKQRGHSRRHKGFNEKWDALSPAEQALCGRNKRDVWTVSTANYHEAHFATYPPALIKPCIMAGCRPGGLVLDPFAGSGTTGAVALELGRRAVLIELNPDYVKLINQRCNTTTPGLSL